MIFVILHFRRSLDTAALQSRLVVERTICHSSCYFLL